MKTARMIEKLPQTLATGYTAPDKRRSSYSNHFKTYDYNNDMEFTGIDIYITDAGFALGRLRYLDGKLFIFKTEDNRIKPEQDEWLEMNTDIKKYIDKRKDEGKIIPMIEEDPTKESVMKAINKELGKVLGIKDEGLNKSKLMLNNFINEVLKHEIPSLW